MTSDDLLGTVLGIVIVVAVIAVILAGLFYRPAKHKKTRSRSTVFHGIDDAPVDGDGSSD